MKRSISAYDVAKVANVSQSTVSRVLNNYPHVRPKTREKVLQAIKELGFSPDSIARSLALNKSNTIGLIIEDLSNPFYAETAHIILKKAKAYNYEIIILDSVSNEHTDLQKALNTLMSKRVDGIIVSSVARDNKYVKDYIKNIPIIFYNRIILNENFDYIEVDNKYGAKMGVNHLYSLGHKKIAYISGQTIYSTFYNRLEGYKDALIENKLPYKPEYVFQGETNYEEVLKFTMNLMKSDDAPTAYFASTDQLAFAILDAASKLDFKIPDDISVIGFDNINISGNPYIGLTTISQQKELMAEMALEKVINSIEVEQDETLINKIILQPELIVRNTTGKIKSKK